MTFAATLNRPLLVPRYPLLEQVCQFSVNMFLWAFRLPLMRSRVVVGQLPGQVGRPRFSLLAGVVCEAEQRSPLAPGTFLLAFGRYFLAEREIKLFLYVGFLLVETLCAWIDLSDSGDCGARNRPGLFVA